jgi:imidazoleglycerol-phosphate dehydratase
MIQLICRRSSLNIDAEFKCVLDATFAQHVVWEDVGMVLGVGISQLLNNRRDDGVEGAGFGVACIDEVLSKCYLSFEGRAGCFIKIADSDASRRELVEDAKTQDVRQFFEGFAQGARATVHLEIGPSFDTHHLWESAFRAFGEALRVCLQSNDWRKGVIVGVKDVQD